MSITRRGFLGRSGWLAASSVVLPRFSRGADSLPAHDGQKPRHIIHLVADGMSVGTLTCADHLSQLVRQRGLTWWQLCRRPGAHTAWMNMRSLNSLVTDSSAASSSWGSGSRIVNGTVNILPDGRALKTLYELFGQAGWKRALVTTTEITHATPAGFAASGLKREAAESIAVQYMERGIEILLGGGQTFFDPAKRKDKRDLPADYRAAGYAVVTNAPGLKGAPNDKRWLGIFTPSHLPYTIDHIADPKALAEVPTLASMTRRALEKLEREEHFIMQVEGGRVDHACHNNDAAAALRDQIAFDEAVDVCVEFQQRHPDTLLVITTDHGNANLGLNGTGPSYGSSSPLFANIKQIKMSFPEILKQLGKKENPAEIQAIIRDTTGYDVTVEKAAAFAPFLVKKGRTLYDTMNTPILQLGQLLGNQTAIGWTSGSHTADYVPLVAFGPGAELFQGFIQNTDLFHHYLGLAKIDFKNPEVPLLAECGPTAEEVELAEAYWNAGVIA
jgi:alkaline phosphatase